MPSTGGSSFVDYPHPGPVPLSEREPALVVKTVSSPAPRRLKWERFGLNFLVISILAHIFFGVIATYFIVQTITAKPKQGFTGKPAQNASTHAIEHKVQMVKKQQTMSAPASARRIATTGPAKVTLPTMPTMPAMSSATTPIAMAGMGGTSVGLGGLGGGSNGGVGGGSALSLFGLRTGGKGLKGTFYDLKQTRNRTPSSVKDLQSFVHQLDLFLQGGWHESSLSLFFMAPTPLYATQIFVPDITSDHAPKAFGVEGQVQASYWMALYKGQVSPPESGVYHFVGGGDNILIVHLNGVVVLDRSWDYQSKFGIDRNWKPLANYDYGFGGLGGIPNGFAKGQGIQLNAGEFYGMQVLLGDDGGVTHFSLLVEKEGVEYAKTAKGLPILPVFRTSGDAPPPGDHPPFAADGPIWTSRAALLSAP